MIEEETAYVVSGKTLRGVLWVIANSRHIWGGPFGRQLDKRVDDVWRALMGELGEDPDKSEEYADL